MTRHIPKTGSSRPLSFTRRNLIRSSLAATVLFPLLEAGRAQAASNFPTRLLIVTTPNGTRDKLFWPKGTESNFQLNTLTTPLEPFKNRLTFLKGIKLNDSLQNGALGGTLGSEHARGTGGMLTARPLNAGTQFKSFGNTTSGWGSGQSIDQYLAERFGSQTTFKSLQLGVHVRDTEVRARISYRGSNQPNPPREDPADVFKTLFGALATNRLAAQRTSVFDLTRSEIQRVMNAVGTDDRTKLEAHLTSMRDVEQRLTQAQSGGGSSCKAPTMQTVDLKADDQYLTAGRLQTDLAAAALACNQTRIISLQWSYSESEHLFQFLNINGNHHSISHDFASSGAGYDNYNKIQTWYAEQVRYLLERLDSYAEGAGTLLDNTLVLWATEIGESTQHALTTMPYVFAGGAGGKIRPGRFIDYSAKPKDNNQMLVSIAHAMGAEDLTQFGDPAGATGPLPGLT
ncbi:MAG TPA: DUF1552 domain-containing protein [Cellvibrionaceae bacterium]